MTEHKIRALADAVTWRGGVSGPVVFTNGVFDLLHPGHVRVLEAARQMGQALIVGVNDDASARRLGKGPGRPVNPAATRARVVAGLAAVDCVVPFSEDTPEQIIAALLPDVLVKGGDYTVDTMIGRDLVEKRGGRAVIVPLLPGHSTSAVLRSIHAAS